MKYSSLQKKYKSSNPSDSTNSKTTNTKGFGDFLKSETFGFLSQLGKDLCSGGGHKNKYHG